MWQRRGAKARGGKSRVLDYIRGAAALKVILFGGVAVFVFMFVLASLLKQGLTSNVGASTQAWKPSSPFNGVRAFKDLERVVGFGPRPPGSPALEQLRGYIREELTRVGLECREQRFTAATPEGPKEMVNLVGVIQGTAPGMILLGTHYDTKLFPFPFVGANDGGSTTAWMLEMARTLGVRREGRSVWLVFFDGEEAIREWSAYDGLYGSRHFVEALRRSGELSRVHAMINVDMIGDCRLGVLREPDAPEWLTNVIWNTAREHGAGAYFLESGGRIEDDHTPFRRAGVAAIDLIDFSYGGSALDHQQNWHTPRDTMERVCAGSLQIVGDVVYHALPRVDAASGPVKGEGG